MRMYRLKKAEFTTFDAAWAGVNTGTCTKQDGRVWHNYVSVLAGSYKDVGTGTLHEYFDYPKCVLNTNEWTCQMYLPSRSKQTDGYPALDIPGVITGRFVASYVPGVELLSFTKVTTAIVTTGATSTTAYASAIVAAIASLMF